MMYQPCQLHPLYPLHDPIPTLLSEVLEVLKPPKMLEVPEVRAPVQQPELELEIEQAGVPPRARSTMTTAVDSSPDPYPGPCLDLGLGFAMELQPGAVHAWAWSQT
jgi:hypothetical protein